MKRIIGSFVVGFSLTALLYLIGVLTYGAPSGGKFVWFYKLLKG